MSASTAWTGDPRVVYQDVAEKVDSLKASRKKDGGSGTDDINNTRHNDASSSGGGDDKRLVSFMFDLPAGPYHQTRHRLPEIWVIDGNGGESRKHYHGRDLGPLDVGSVVVLRERAGGTPIAAYFVGEEEHQVCCVLVSSWAFFFMPPFDVNAGHPVGGSRQKYMHARTHTCKRYAYGHASDSLFLCFRPLVQRVWNPLELVFQTHTATFFARRF